MSKIQFTADCQIQASEAGSPKISILAYTGGAMNLGTLGATVVDLAGMELAQIPLLSDHDNRLASIAGSGTPQVQGGELHVNGTLASGTAAANQVLALHRSGVRLQASIGAEVETQTYIGAGKKVTANGREHVAPAGGMTFVSKSRLREVSLVAMGADSQTSVSIAAMRANRMASQSDFTSWTKSAGIDTSLMTAEQMASLHANYHGRNDADDTDRQAVNGFIAAGAPGDPVEGEQRRLRQIDHACQGDWQEHTERVHQLKASAIAGELSIDQLLQEMRQVRIRQMQPTIPVARTVPSSRQNNGEVLTAALCLAGGLTNPEQHFHESVLDAADRSARNVSLQSLLMTAACQNGYRANPGEYVTDGNLRSVLSAVFTPQIQAQGWSTLDISNVLSNTANKMLLDGFQEVEDPWRNIAAVKPVKNFKTHTFVRLLDSLEFEEVGAAGEITHGTLGDATMTGKAATYAKMVSITRQDIINDDLGALTDVPRKLGRAAAMKFRRLFWTAFLATSDNFFHSNNNNVLTGAGTELDAEGVGLTAALKEFRAQKTSTADGAKLIGGKPSVLLVPPALEIVARRLLTSTGTVTGADATMPNGNPFQGLATLVVADWIGTDAGLTNGDDAKWYLLRSPSYAPAMLVPALNGRVEPTIETADADFNVLGIQMRGYSDVGVARGEPLCGLQVAGTPSGE